jgi:hypothetical protein
LKQVSQRARAQPTGAALLAAAAARAPRACVALVMATAAAAAPLYDLELSAHVALPTGEDGLLHPSATQSLEFEQVRGGTAGCAGASHNKRRCCDMRACALRLRTKRARCMVTPPGLHPRARRYR